MRILRAGVCLAVTAAATAAHAAPTPPVAPALPNPSQAKIEPRPEFLAVHRALAKLKPQLQKVKAARPTMHRPVAKPNAPWPAPEEAEPDDTSANVIVSGACETSGAFSATVTGASSGQTIASANFTLRLTACRSGEAMMDGMMTFAESVSGYAESYVDTIGINGSVAYQDTTASGTTAVQISWNGVVVTVKVDVSPNGGTPTITSDATGSYSIGGTTYAVSSHDATLGAFL